MCGAAGYPRRVWARRIRRFLCGDHTRTTFTHRHPQRIVVSMRVVVISAVVLITTVRCCSVAISSSRAQSGRGPSLTMGVPYSLPY